MTRLRTAVLALATTGLVAATLTATGMAAQAAPELAPLVGPGVSTASTAASVVPGSYIVVLKDAASAKTSATRSAQSGATITHTYSKVLTGYSAELSASQLIAVRQDPAVKYVQRTMVVRSTAIPGIPAGKAIRRSTRSVAASTQKNVDSWGLDRVDQRNLPINGTYTYNTDPAGVSVYVADGGIYAGHPDFGGRVRGGVDEIGTTNGTASCLEYPTHVAGVIGGTYFGVAKHVQLISVRVLDCSGEGTTSSVIAGLDWIAQDTPGTPKVVNLSLTNYTIDATLDAAVQSLIDAGTTVVAEAGDGSRTEVGALDACTASPGHVPGVITVGASTIKDVPPTWTNFGSCIDVYAPGYKVTSDVPGPANGEFWINDLSGSPVAAAFASGTAALYLQRHQEATPAQVAAWITSNASKDKIGGVSTASPNDLLFSLEALPLPAGGITSGDRLREGQFLLPGARLYSANAKYFLAHRSRDGWLCLYNAETGKVVWCNGHNGAWTQLSEGILTSRDLYGRITWRSGGVYHDNAMMVVNGKGYIALVKTPSGFVTWTTPH